MNREWLDSNSLGVVGKVNNGKLTAGQEDNGKANAESKVCGSTVLQGFTERVSTEREQLLIIGCHQQAAKSDKGPSSGGEAVNKDAVNKEKPNKRVFDICPADMLSKFKKAGN
jgi:hypothetical protein